LVEQSGATGHPVTVSVAANGPFPGAVEMMRYVTGVLDDLGLRATLEIVPDVEDYFDGINRPEPDGTKGTPAGSPDHPHVYVSGWGSDYLGAGNWLSPQFSCGARGFANPSGYCNPDLDARMDEALLLYTTDPGAANRAWTGIEHQLVEEGAQAPVTNPITTHAVSARVENVQVHPQWGLLLGRLWVQ
jgi:peptide/nickel transport system substrate-binding protein